jgi:hypothetical protein
LDVLLVGPRLALFRGDGRGRFADVSRATGIDTLSGQFLGCAVGDYDNDGFADLYISGYRTGRLLQNRRGRAFKDVTQAAGLTPQPWGSSCGFADLDRDGRLDLFVANYLKFGPDPLRYKQRCEPLTCGPEHYVQELPAFFRNHGGGRFEDASRTSGARPTAAGKGLGVAFADYDDDGDQDVILANDQMPGDLFHNDGSARFVNRGILSGTAFGPDCAPHGGMGVDWADYNNDGRLDAVVTTYAGQPTSLYRNEGKGLFYDVASCPGPPNAGIGKPTQPYVGFGAKWLDFDNDGWPDLLIANGHVDNKVAQKYPDKSYRQPTQAFRNVGTTGPEGEVRFADVSDALGAALQRPIVGRGLASGDFDNDGRIDALVIDDDGPVLLLHNQGGAVGNWIGLKLIGSGRSNRDALGARVTLEAGGRTQVREVQTAGSYLSASDSRVHFGLGKATGVGRITVRWPDGQVQTLAGLAPNRYHTIQQGRS